MVASIYGTNRTLQTVLSILFVKQLAEEKYQNNNIMLNFPHCPYPLVLPLVFPAKFHLRFYTPTEAPVAPRSSSGLTNKMDISSTSATNGKNEWKNLQLV